MKMKTLENKIALITGGSQGLGEQITRVLAEAGTTVLIGDIKKEQAQQLSEELKEKKYNAESFLLDVGEENSVTQVINAIQNKYKRIDILINNAGIDVTKPLDDMSVEEFDRVIKVNLRGSFLLSKKLFPLMERQGAGHIINITSTAAKRAWANASAYHASKWGLLGMSHALHVEGRQKNIKVSAVVAGGMRTPFILERFPDTPLDVLQDPRNVAETIKFILLQPDETVIPEVMVLPMKETSWP